MTKHYLIDSARTAQAPIEPETRAHRRPRILEVRRTRAGHLLPPSIVAIAAEFQRGLLDGEGAFAARAGFTTVVVAGYSVADRDDRKRGWKSNGRASVCALASQLLAHSDLESGRVGVPEKGRFVRVPLSEWGRRAGISPRTSERASTVLKRLGILRVERVKVASGGGAIREEAPRLKIVWDRLANLCEKLSVRQRDLRRLAEKRDRENAAEKAARRAAKEEKAFGAAKWRRRAADVREAERRAVAELLAKRAAEAAKSGPRLSREENLARLAAARALLGPD